MNFEKLFKLKQNNTTVRTEVMAGITIFFASVFAILTIPNLIGQGDVTLMNGVFVAGVLSAAAGSLLKAFAANLPFVQVPGMGLGSFFAFTAMPAVAVMTGIIDMPAVRQYQMALALVFISGIAFVATSIGGIRQFIIDGVPQNIKLALGAGIGLFIAALGLRQSGLIVANPGTLVALVDFSSFSENPTPVLGALLSLAGLAIMVVLFAKKVKGGILIGIIVTTILAYLTGHTPWPETFSFSLAGVGRDFLDVSFLRLDFSLFTSVSGAAWGSLFALGFTFFLINLLDALGTIYGIASANGMVDEKGEVTGLQRGMTVDALGTVIGSLFGSSSTATTVSSAAGIAEGGRTGLTSLVTGVLFLSIIFLAPLVNLIPLVATAPALIFVGCLMMTHIKEVDFSDVTETVPAFLTIVIMPMTSSIGNGTSIGLISYVVIKLLTGRFKEIKLSSVVIAAFLLLQFIL
ncbi:MAG: NCS2 family permease [Defluviitaleaceae bacterium]|nr:NCS2 family permease [Defluviitaleaceae bacterium]